LGWTIQFRPSALKELKKLDKPTQKKILKFLNTRISPLDNPRIFGKALSYDKHGLWRYRVEDFRIICSINDETVLILVMQVGHRKKIYNA
jgi:mRNA interferase RelE/StbE